MLGLGVFSLMLGREGLLCAPAAPLFFADASEVPPNNKAVATTIRADFVMLFHHNRGPRRISPIMATANTLPRHQDHSA